MCLQCMVEGGLGFNPYPPDCERYVVCRPRGQTYDPTVQSCPFGLFWSNKAVSCLDSRYVDCPNDRCKSMMAGGSYASSSGNCRSYFRCSNSSRSSPVCCQTGFRYIDGFGCTYDPSCVDPCPLEVTINNEACSALVRLPFTGSFEDTSRHPQPIQARGVVLSRSDSAYFDGTGYIALPSTANLQLGQTFVIKLRFRRRGDSTPEAWNTNWSWGFQTWYNNASNSNTSRRVIVGNTPITAPDNARPKGALTTPLEIITIARDGTVIRDPRYQVKVNTTWPGDSQARVTVLTLGRLGKLSTPTLQNGILYVPGSQNRILVQEPTAGVSGSVRFEWKIVRVGDDGTTGTVEKTGEGAVPLNIQQEYGLSLRAPLRESWWVLAPGGLVLESGEGAMPRDVINRYRGFTSGTLVKVFDRGQGIERWRVSRPDETQLQVGDGEIPKSLRDQYSMEKFLGGTKVTAKTWAVLGADGTILQQGKGDVPSSVMSRYSGDSSVTVLVLTSQDGGAVHWQVMRTSGVTLLEGRGLLPDGIAGFVRGRLQLPQISQVTEWRVTLPDGSIRTGTGDIPQSLLELFNATRTLTSGSARFPPAGSDVIKRWTITLPDGSARSG
ncbi:hypothetical protein EGW08_017541, partial [Elysia chlorotica]